MNILDILIAISIISSLLRGKQLGFARQLSSTIGFFGGLLLGALLQPHIVHLAHSQLSRAVLTICATLGIAFIGLSLGEYIGIVIKTKIHSARPLNKADNALGSGIAVVSTLIGIWLGAAILLSLPSTNLQDLIRGSRIVGTLNRHLPAAPNVVAELGRLVNPNGFPKVFTGNEPELPTDVSLPSLGDLQTAVKTDQASVVKVEGQGCGGIVEGSGFVVSKDLIATNAHVIAGIATPYVQDANGSRQAKPVWFDPNLDFALLQVNNLSGSVLPLNTAKASSGTPGVVLGYPGGGDFTAKSAAVLDEFTATGRNIYNQGETNRDVYELKADIIPGNSGGPFVDKNGAVLGVVFAESTEYNHVGYAFNSSQIVQALTQAKKHTGRVSTGSCAE